MTDKQPPAIDKAASKQRAQIETASISLHGVRWLYVREDPAYLAEFNSSQEISGLVIKSSRKRLVICSPEGIFVKQIYYRGLPSLMKGLAGGTACKEGKINLELARRGVSVPNVIAYGVVERLGMLERDLLLTEKVKEAVSLENFVVNRPKCPVFSEKQKFIHYLVHFIKGLHNKGVEHTDLHLGNILVQGENRIHFYLLDVDRVILHGGKLSGNRRIKNLALLLCTFQTLSSSLERFRFLKSYYDRKHLREISKELGEIKRVASRVSLKVWTKKARRCLHNNSRFLKTKSGSFKVLRVNEPEVEKALDALLPNPDRILYEGALLKNGRTVRAAKVEIDGRTYFLKRYNCKGTWYRMRNAFRRSRAVRTWLSTWSLTVRDVPVPKALICLVERRFGLLERSYILYNHVDAYRLCDLWPQLDDFSKRRCLIKLAIVLGNMHRFGGYHGDLKWPNILVSQIEERPRITLSDLDGSRIYSTIPPRKACKDITRLIMDLGKAGEQEELKKLFLETWRKWSGMELINSATSR